ncbi:MAG TPA: ribonuclease PH [Chloroflexi bacterium]|nr:ribonuclease PH [Chloroflexota bacterium]
MTIGVAAVSPERGDGRRPDEMRPVHFTLDYVTYPEGSVLVEMGATRVLCNVSVDDGVPAWLAGQGRGWITAEYALLPRATHTRTPREVHGFRGRTQEIRRLIGRALRVAVDLNLVGERTLIVDCDVLQADGGTRCAAITGGYVAVALAMRRLQAQGVVPVQALRSPVAAISVGLLNGLPLLDLSYAEDRIAGVDLNVVMDAAGALIEIQGTAERTPFSRTLLDDMLDLATQGITRLIQAQREALDKR